MEKTLLVDALSNQQADFFHCRQQITGHDKIVTLKSLKFKALTEKC
jgi:hypothetical protein